MNGTATKRLGLGSAVLLGVNGIVGSGIFLLPGQVSALVGPWSFAVYLFVSLMTLSIGWCFAQCAALFTQNGGAYLYARRAFGDFVGFQVGFMRGCVSMIAWASLSVGLVGVLGTIWPEAECEPTRSLIIASLVMGLGALNIISREIITVMNNTITVAKLVLLAFFVGVGVFFVDRSHILPETLPPFSPLSFGAAALITFYAFSGFESLATTAGEMENPRKTVPLAVMLTIGIVSTLYLLIQIISMGTLGDRLPESLMPISDVANVVFGASGKLFITILMLVCMLGVNISASFVCPRNLLVLAEDGLIPQWIAKKTTRDIPSRAILVTTIATTLVALSGSFLELAAITAVSRFLQYVTTCSATLVFYKPIKQKEWYRIILPAIALTGSAWIIFQTPPYQLACGFAALLFSIPLYFFRRHAMTNPSVVTE